MIKVMKHCVVPFVLALVATTGSSEAQDIIEGGLGEPTEGFKREPTLIYDVTGSTILGPIHTSLIVYNDGYVSYSKFESFALEPEEFIHKLVPDVIVKRLTNDLRDAGIMNLQDSVSMAVDVPVTTVTYMRPQINANAHTYSHDSVTVGQLEVVFIIAEFIQDWVLTGNNIGSIAEDSDDGNPVSAGVAPTELKQEPVLVYTIEGTNLLTGPITRSFVVYNNGLVSVAEALDFFSLVEVYSTMTTPFEVRNLNANLAKAGAGMLPDGENMGTDGFRVTVTYFRGGTDARAHSFSFLEGDPNLAYTNIQLQVGVFLDDNISNPFAK